MKGTTVVGSKLKGEMEVLCAEIGGDDEKEQEFLQASLLNQGVKRAGGVPPAQSKCASFRHPHRYDVIQNSELLFPEAVSEEEESGALVLLVLLVGEAHGTIVVLLRTNEELHLSEVASDELDELSGALLKAWDAVLLAELIELGGGLGKVALGPGHEVGFGEALNLNEAHLVLDVDNGLTTFVVHLVLVLGGDSNVVRALGDVLGLSLDASILHSKFVGERVGEELVTADVVHEYLHSFFSCFL